MNKSIDMNKYDRLVTSQDGGTNAYCQQKFLHFEYIVAIQCDLPALYKTFDLTESLQLYKKDVNFPHNHCHYLKELLSFYNQAKKYTVAKRMSQLPCPMHPMILN